MTISVSPLATLSIGSGSSFNDYCFITSSSSIVIGCNVLCGEFVSIRDADHAFSKKDILIRSQGYVKKEIEIQDNVWIGRGATILKGVCIGEGTVVGANSVVTKSVPPFSVVGGVPAKIIKAREIE